MHLKDLIIKFIQSISKNNKMEEYEYIMLKLVSGELIISRIDSSTENEYILEYPTIINYTHDFFNFKTQIYFVAVNPFNIMQKLFTLNKKHVMMVFDVDIELIVHYEKTIRKKINQYDESEEENYSLEEFEITPNTSMN